MKNMCSSPQEEQVRDENIRIWHVHCAGNVVLYGILGVRIGIAQGLLRSDPPKFSRLFRKLPCTVQGHDHKTPPPPHQVQTNGCIKWHREVPLSSLTGTYTISAEIRSHGKFSIKKCPSSHPVVSPRRDPGSGVTIIINIFILIFCFFPLNINIYCWIWQYTGNICQNMEWTRIKTWYGILS